MHGANSGPVFRFRLSGHTPPIDIEFCLPMFSQTGVAFPFVYSSFSLFSRSAGLPSLSTGGGGESGERKWRPHYAPAFGSYGTSSVGGGVGGGSDHESSALYSPSPSLPFPSRNAFLHRGKKTIFPSLHYFPPRDRDSSRACRYTKSPPSLPPSLPPSPPVRSSNFDLHFCFAFSAQVAATKTFRSVATVTTTVNRRLRRRRRRRRTRLPTTTTFPPDSALRLNRGRRNRSRPI